MPIVIGAVTEAISDFLHCKCEASYDEDGLDAVICDSDTGRIYWDSSLDCPQEMFAKSDWDNILEIAEKYN